MGKKGKDKAPAPAPVATGSSSGSSKKSSKPSAAANKPEDDFIVFTNSTKDNQKSRRGGQGSAAPTSGDPAVLGPPKPTVKQIIGGASWTGKLPVNLLSEHCQKQKWDRPDYQPVSLFSPQTS